MTARATEAFQFATASYLVRVGNQAAVNLGELQQGRARGPHCCDTISSL